MNISYFCCVLYLITLNVLGKVYDSKMPGERVDSPENKPTATHLLDHYLQIIVMHKKKLCSGFGIMMTKNSADHELFELMEWYIHLNEFMRFCMESL